VSPDATTTRELKVVHVSVVHGPDDQRIFDRECRSLADAGYRVAYLVPGAAPGRRDGVLQRSLPSRPRARRWLQAPYVVRELARLRPHVAHVHDPELLTLLPLLRTFVPRLVYDMHEYLSQQVLDKPYLPAPARPVVAGAVRVAQCGLAAFADGVAGIAEEQFDDLGRRPALRVVLPNYPRLSRFMTGVPRPEMTAERRLKLVHFGALTRPRGLKIMLDVMEQAGDGAVLYLAGPFADSEEQRETEARLAAGLRDRVKLLGRVPPSEVPDYLAGADIVWVPWTTTVYGHRPLSTTKLYEGMAAGLAALASDLPGRGDVVRDAGCGLAVSPTFEGHAAGLRRLISHRDEVTCMGELGRRAVQSRYSWEAVEGDLVDFYDRLCRDVRQGASP
jgi:glycosyltransferase involved in cell wall biosynthesis